MDKTLFSCVAGSYGYGLNTELSDIDVKSVFLASLSKLYGFRMMTARNDNPNDPFYREEKYDKDKTEINGHTIDREHFSFELEKFIWLLKKANPNIIEMLFTNIQFNVHPIFKYYILNNKESFVTKSFVNNSIAFIVTKLKKQLIDIAHHNYNKEVSHCVRIAKMLQNFLDTGNLIISFKGDDRKELLKIKSGNFDNDYYIKYLQDFVKQPVTVDLRPELDELTANEILVAMRKELFY